jgi:hypothetical protein
MKRNMIFMARMYIKQISCLVSLIIFLISGCATSWENKGSFYQTLHANLTVHSNPDGTVYVNNRIAGNSPVTIPLEYEQQINRKARKVSYWKTEPGLSMLLTIVSLGIYLPFSIIPVDTETSLEAQASFKNNEFNISVKTDSYKVWHQIIRLSGEKELALSAALDKGGE